jgi:hypothetical protein
MLAAEQGASAGRLAGRLGSALKMHGGHLTPDNVRLAHRLCNQRDYMAEEDQRAAREADVAGGDRREAERGGGSNDSRYEQMDSCICPEGIRFSEAAQSPGSNALINALG